MKKSLLIAATAALALFSAPLGAATITLTPADMIIPAPPLASPNNCEPDCINDAFPLASSPLVLYYKADVGGSDSGSFASSYETAFDNTQSDPEDATITWLDSPLPAIGCPECYLAVADGNNQPIYYFYNLAAWNGEDTIALTGFWTGNGAISHVAIWGYSSGGEEGGGEEGGGEGGGTIPEPAMLTLFGLGLALVASRLRRH